MFAFLVTLALVDNLYMMLLAGGSYELMERVNNQNLEPYLFYPRRPLMMFALTHVDPSHILGVLLSAVCLVVYYVNFAVPLPVIAAHLAAIFVGIFVLNGISFLYRLTTFWSNAIVSIRSSNPSFKVMIRPMDSFGGGFRLALLTIFPALFITGVPAKIAVEELPSAWLLLAIAAALGLWLAATLVWRVGVRRYLTKVV